MSMSKTKPKQIKVRAKDLGQKYSGYYNHVRRQPDDVFIIADEAHFSPAWMERVDEHEPITAAPGEIDPPEVTHLPGKATGDKAVI